MPITPTDLGGDEDTARRILVLARSIAPCIDSLADDSEGKKDAIAVLKGVLSELPGAGSRRVRSMSRNGTSMTYSDIKTAFDSDSRESLRTICSQSRSSKASLPVGSFPKVRTYRNEWPEGEYT